MRGHPIVVLLVEDNLDHAELVMRALGDHRVLNTVCHVRDGQSALDYLFHRGPYADIERSPTPHVVLLDLRLPGVDGIEVLKAIKASEDLRRIPVVVLTSSEAERDVARAYNNHVNSYLVKPVGFEEFSKLMDDLGFYWLGWNTFPS